MSTDHLILQACAKGKKQRVRGRMKPGLGGGAFSLLGGDLSYLDNTSLPPKHQPNTLELGGWGKPGPPSASNCISLPRFLSWTRAIKHFCRQQTFPTTFTYHHFHHPHLPNLTIHQRRKPSPLHPFAQHSINTFSTSIIQLVRNGRWKGKVFRRKELRWKDLCC